MAALLCSLTLYQARQHRPCHQRAIHSGHKRSPADTHGQHLAPVSCGGHHLSRSRSRRIWLWEQGVSRACEPLPLRRLTLNVKHMHDRVFA